MNLTSIMTWIKSNLLISIGVALVAVVLLFPKLFKGLLGSLPRKRRRGTRIYGRPSIRRPTRSTVSRIRTIGRIRRPGLRRRKGAKKPWQIKGSLAARRHMALIRKRK
jgi:hypothetical protein